MHLILAAALWLLPAERFSQATASVAASPAVSVTSLSPPATRPKPDAAERRCIASRRRTERAQQVIADADARLARERQARDTCVTKRACGKVDHALKASEARMKRYAQQLAHYESEARDACAKD